MLTACGGGGGGGGSGGGSGSAAAAGSGNSSSAPEPNITDSSGNVSASSYRAMAQAIAKDRGIAYRYGTPSTASGMPQIPAANSTPYPKDSSYGTSVTWQVGGPYDASAGDYSSNQGQYAFVPDNESQHAGIGTLEFLAQRNNTFSEAPQPSWTFPDNVALAPAGTNPYYNTNAPAAMGRCYGDTCAQSVIAFANGTVGVFGSNTTPTRTTVQLDAGKVPTAVALTNAGEFALITVWDTVNLKGQVAVVALASSQYHMDWTEDYPGLPNQGTYDFMKVLGYVDLPGMMAPTEISATTGVQFESYHRMYPPTGSDPATCSSNFNLAFQMPLRTSEVTRLSFAPGGCNYGAYAHGGVAVVVSKTENKAAFINLKPLFDYYQSMYFGTRSNFDQTANLGQASNQWPYPFSAASGQMPTVIKTVDLGKRPTAVKTALWTTQRAWIATEDGTLQLYSLGRYASDGAATPSDIALKGSVAVGKNPTALAYAKHDPAGGDPIIDSVIVVSRGESKIQWVAFNPDFNGGSIRRTLQDSRLKDPVWAEDNDNHGTESFVLTVADYAGKQVSNYRYGPVVFRTNAGGACQTSTACPPAGQFEYGGSYGVPGKVFQVTGANVP
ncbi:MAG: hypothetical protein JSS56_27090 [Proteobacteria bacterium]|nr:hypothetical protein [Pseudomonadota bacterium]